MFRVFLLLDLRIAGGLREPRAAPRADPHVVATISTVQMFFLFLMVAHKNPFDVPDGGADRGRGLNPLPRTSTWRFIRHRSTGLSG
jgi:cytochrome c biogenesis factor